MKNTPRKELSMFDSTCIIVGVIIGAGIYESAPQVAAGMGTPVRTLAIWLAGGFLAFAGALCYAELASAYPREGGDYVYLTRAYGPWSGFMFGWAQLAIVRPGDIALMAFVFGRYASSLYSPFGNSLPVYAAAAVAVFTLINILGVTQGKWTQNILTVVKALGLFAIVVVGFLGNRAEAAAAAQPQPFEMAGLKLALIYVLFTYGGWNEMAYVAAEVRNPKKNIVRALITGTVTVTILYILINGAFLHTLGQDKTAASEAVAVDTVSTALSDPAQAEAESALPETVSRLIAVLICISALGAVNGLVLTGARITYALGADHREFRIFGVWDAQRGSPVRALLAQGLLAIIIIIFAESFIDTIIYNAPVYWLFTLGTALSVFTLRRKDADIERPYRITGHPVTTIIFILCCLFMIYSCITYAWAFKPKALAISGGVLLLGALIYARSADMKAVAKDD